METLGLSSDALWAFAYLSSPSVPFSDRDLSDLLLSARAFNNAQGLSGKLVVLEHGRQITRFAQWIEGPRSALAMSMTRIVRDGRHDTFDVRHLGPVATRRFPGWDMAVLPADSTTFPGAVAHVTA